MIWTGLMALGLGLVFFFYRVRVILTPFVLAFFLAYLLEPPVAALVRRGVGRVWAIVLVYVGVGLLAAAAVFLVLPRALAEVSRLVANLPAYAADLEYALVAVQERYDSLAMPSGLRAAMDDVILRLQGMAMGQVQLASGLVLGLFHGLFSLVVAPLIAFYILKDMDLFRRGFVAWLPQRSRRPLLRLLHDLNAVLSGFVRGQLLVALAVGVMAAAAAGLLGLRYAMLIGLVAGITDVIPYFGPVMGALPALVLAAPMGAVKMLEVVIAFALVHQMENAVVGPKIMADSVGLHPLTVMFAILAGGMVAGVAGMILSVPVVGMLKVLAAHAYRWLVNWRESWPSLSTRPKSGGSEAE
ncbi:MAG: AI-2E family transporter [Bacillota bacterium]